MKFLIVLAFVAVVAARPDDYSRYENFNVDEITGNLRLLKAYCDCFQGTGKCTPEGNDFKKWIPEALKNSCGDCSEHQKTLVAKMIIAIQEQLPEEWEQLNKHFNPDGKHDDTLKAFLDKNGH